MPEGCLETRGNDSNKGLLVTLSGLTIVFWKTAACSIVVSKFSRVGQHVFTVLVYMVGSTGCTVAPAWGNGCHSGIVLNADAKFH